MFLCLIYKILKEFQQRIENAWNLLQSLVLLLTACSTALKCWQLKKNAINNLMKNEKVLHAANNYLQLPKTYYINSFNVIPGAAWWWWHIVLCCNVNVPCNVMSVVDKVEIFVIIVFCAKVALSAVMDKITFATWISECFITSAKWRIDIINKLLHFWEQIEWARHEIIEMHWNSSMKSKSILF